MVVHGEVAMNQLKDLAGAIGAVLNKVLYDESVEIAGHYKSITDLETLSPKVWLERRNKVITEFLDRATDVRRKSSDDSEQKALRLCHLYEQLLGT